MHLSSVPITPSFVRRAYLDIISAANPVSDTHPFLHSRLSLSYLSWNQFKFCLLNCDHLFLKQDQTQPTSPPTNTGLVFPFSCLRLPLPPSLLPKTPSPRSPVPPYISLHPPSPPFPSRHPSPLHFLPTYDRFSRKQSRTKKTNISPTHPTSHLNRAITDCHHSDSKLPTYSLEAYSLEFLSHPATPMRRRCQKRASAGGLKALGNLSVAPRGLSPPDQLI